MAEHSPGMQHGAKHIAKNEDEMRVKLSNKGLYEDLGQDFADWFSSVSAETFDESLLDDFLAEMEELNPLEDSFDSQKSLEEFHKRLSALSLPRDEQGVPHPNMQPVEPPHKHRRVFRWGAVVAATIAIMMASMVTAQAFGVDVFGFLARWTDEIFFYENAQPQIQEQRTYPMTEGESVKYESVDAALEAFDVDLPFSPKWLPDYVGDLEVTGEVTPNGMRISSSYYDNSCMFTMTISEFPKQSGPSFIIEKNSEDVRIYEMHGRTHYIMNDCGIYTVTWIADNIQCIISGSITEEELINILNSVYEEV